MLTDRFTDALVYATQLHAIQVRKGCEVPYISHLMGVASLVMEMNGDEDECIAALLHDAVEDQGGKPQLEQIRAKFGDRVAAIVDGCTDAYEEPKPPWRGRKEAYIAHIATAERSNLLVSAADKLHNARAILTDYRSIGDELWERFNPKQGDVLWYYDELARAFAGRQNDESRIGPLFRELSNIVEQLYAETGFSR